MDRLGIVAATEAEAAWVRRGLSVEAQSLSPAGGLWQGELLGLPVALLRCGMGPERASLGLEWLVSQGPLWGLLSVGFAGGLQPRQATGDAVIGATMHALESFESSSTNGATMIVPDKDWETLARLAAAQAGLVTHAGALISTASLLPKARDKQELGRESGAVAIDMESYHLARSASVHHLPFHSLRTIFDTSQDNLELPSERITTADGRLRLGPLLGYLGRHPRSLAQLPSLWRKARVAGQHLEAWLTHFLTLLKQQRSTCRS